MPDQTDDSKVFVAYVRASILLGDIAESCQQGRLTHARFAELRNALHFWLKDLPSTIRHFEPASDENFNMRQVYMLYLSALAILHRSTRSTKSPSAVELITSSLIVRLFEHFHSRNELRRLSAGFNFYPIVAAIPQLEALQFQSLNDCIRIEMNVIEDSLRDLGKRWPSAHRGLEVLKKVRQGSKANPRNTQAHPGLPDDSNLLLFENFDFSECRMWHTLSRTDSRDNRSEPVRTTKGASQLEESIPYMAIPSSTLHEPPLLRSDLNPGPSTAVEHDDLSFWLSDATFDQDLFGGWMLNDDAFSMNLDL
jgi:hypothetical protein